MRRVAAAGAARDAAAAAEAAAEAVGGALTAATRCGWLLLLQDMGWLSS